MTGTVMITAGGTGGHVFPGLAVAAKLVARGWRVFWLGTRDGMEGALVRRHGVEFESVAFRGVRGKGWKTALLGPFALAAAWWQSRKIIRRRAPDVVLGFGGFASVPGRARGRHAVEAAGAARRQRDRGTRESRARLLRRSRSCSAFPDAMRGRHAGKVEWVGNPVREDFGRVPAPEARFAGRAGPLRLLVVGGSLGAAAINRCVPRALALMPAASRPHVVHQSGARHLDALRSAYERGRRRGAVRARSSTTWRRTTPTPTSSSAAAARSPSRSSRRWARPRSSCRCRARSPTSRARTRSFSSPPARRSTIAQAELTPERLAASLASFAREALLAMAVAGRKLARLDAADRVADACIACGAGR